MSENKWTVEQEKAIVTDKCNLLVAAAAGSGKTAVLVERIIRKITSKQNPIDIDRLLVVTFTNAAAAEMRERIGNAIGKALDESPESSQLQRQMTLLTKANIMTIHSFCLDVIRNNFHAIDIDPDFRIADDTETILLRQDCIEEIFEEEYENGNEEFLRLVECYGEKDDTRLEDMVLNLYRFSQSAPWPEKWLKEAAEDFNIDGSFKFNETKWAHILLDNIRIELSGLEKAMLDALETVHSTEGLEHYAKAFENDAHNLEKLNKTEEWDDFIAVLKDIEFLSLSAKRVDESIKSIKEKVKAVRDEAKKKIEGIRNELCTETEDIGEVMKFMYPILKELSNVVIEFGQRYSERKRERGIIDFNDIEHFCLKILENEEAAKQYVNKFEEILIDEYQDSNLVQEEILNSISKKKEGKSVNIFMVGDVKQSIYRFRQAMPELFLKKYEEYSEEEGKLDRKIKLFKNFRSRKEIVYGVNFIFNKIMSVNVGELNYDDGEALNPGANYEQYEKQSMAIELNIIDKSNDETEIDLTDADISNEEQPDGIQLEARLVGKRIKELVNSEFLVFDKNIGASRPVQYRDIVVLMRTTANWSQVFTDEFTKMNIPTFADTGTGYFETNEIRTILALLEIIDNPMQDIPLIAVLRSPIGDFTTEELINIRLVDKEISFYEAMVKLKDLLEPSDMTNEITDKNLKNTAEKTEEFLKRLDKWRAKELFMSIDEFIWYLYTDTGYYGYAGAMPGGTQRQANLRMLFERARVYEETSYKGLFNFINFIRKLRNSSGDMGSAKILGEEENVIRIMSIHKSKGLEFPVVIAAGMGKNFNLQDMNRSMLYHVKLGYGPDFIDSKRRITYPTIIKQALKKKIKLETLSEEMRILYVALTRAKEKLIITGVTGKLQGSMEKWMRNAAGDGEKLSEYGVMNARNYLDWICPAVIRHKDGEVLRERVKDSDIYINDDASKWNIKLWNMAEFAEENDDENTEEFDIIKEIASLDESADKSSYSSEIDKILDWKYKYHESEKMPAKISVSEIKRKLYEEMLEENSEEFFEYSKPVNLRKPVFMENTKKFTAAEKGTLLHLVMQHIDISKTSSIEDIKLELNRLREKEFITSEELKVINPSRIYDFWNSNLGKRMINSGSIKRETPFYIEISSTEIYKELENDIYDDEKILVQGIIDCYFIEDGEIVLVDYKTDFVENVEMIKEKYRVQLDYYGRALEKITELKVKQKYLYAFYSGTEIEV